MVKTSQISSANQQPTQITRQEQTPTQERFKPKKDEMNLGQLSSAQKSCSTQPDDPGSTQKTLKAVCYASPSATPDRFESLPPASRSGKLPQSTK